MMLFLGLVTVLTGVAMSQSSLVPVTSLVIPMVLASSSLGPRTLPWFVVFVLGVMVIVVAATANDQLGVAGARSESMLVDLRDRITKQGHIPALPEDWHAEAVTRSAGASSFAGDFMVASLSRDGDHFEVAVVDVSGKGEQAGTRALLLSGAFGGLLGSMPPENFLPAANDYLLRQDWNEGFATAVHLALRLSTGEFEIRSAGHPPAVQMKAGSGRWAVHEAEGPILGLMPEAEFTVVRGVLNRGDALLMFTDGLVETPTRDIALGIDKLLGQGERLLRSGFVGGARRLIVQSDSINDDRALFLLHRK